LGLIVALTRWAIEDWITESYGLLWHNHSAAVAQTETMPKKSWRRRPPLHDVNDR